MASKMNIGKMAFQNAQPNETSPEIYCRIGGMISDFTYHDSAAKLAGITLVAIAMTNTIAKNLKSPESILLLF